MISLYLNHDFQGSGEQGSVVMKFTQIHDCQLEATSTSSHLLSFQPTYPQAPQSQSCAVKIFLGIAGGMWCLRTTCLFHPRKKRARRAIKGSCPIVRDPKTGTCFSLAQVALCFQSINQHGLTPGTVLPSWCVVHNNGTIHSYMVHAKCMKRIETQTILNG